MSAQAPLETMSVCACGASIERPVNRYLVCEHILAGAEPFIDRAPTVDSAGVLCCSLCHAAACTGDPEIWDLLDDSLNYTCTRCAGRGPLVPTT